MIKDLELLYDIRPLFCKKLVIWGIGLRGMEVLKEIEDMGAGKEGLILCDSDENKRGGVNVYAGRQIFSPLELKKYLQNIDLQNIIICIMVDNIKAQDEILNEIDQMSIGEIDIYTSFAVKWGIYYALNSDYINENYRQKKIREHKIEIQRENSAVDVDAIKYFAFAPLHNDQIILVYQPGKAGSTTVHASILKFGRYALHRHSLRHVGYTDTDLQKLVNQKSGKIICMVREPISRTIASMWQNVQSIKFYSEQADFKEIENRFLREGFENWQFVGWFEREMKYVFGIDIYEYPFDKERGYQIIKSGNIELLLMKMEKLNDLESVIGEFLGIEDFKLEEANVGEEKEYRFAYQEYKKRFYISPERLEAIYDNQYVKHFYTENERVEFIERYRRKRSG